MQKKETLSKKKGDKFPDYYLEGIDSEQGVALEDIYKYKRKPSEFKSNSNDHQLM